MSDSADALLSAFADSVEPISEPPDGFVEWVREQIERGHDADATNADLRGDRPAD